MPPSAAPQLPASSAHSALVPIAFNPNAPSTPETRTQRTTAFMEKLARQYSLIPDDPIYAHLALIQFHEESLALMVEGSERFQTEAGQNLAKLLAASREGHQELLQAVKAETARLDEHRQAGKRLADEAIEDQAAFRAQVGEVLAGMSSFKQDQIDAKGLGLIITNATNTLTKRALFESVISYLLPLLGAILGAIALYVFMLKSGLVLQIVPGQPAPTYQAIPSNQGGPNQPNP